MKKFSYVIIPLLSFVGPFAMSFDRRVNFIQYIVPVLIAIASVGCMYIVWDVIVTRKGHWQFNNEYVGAARVLNLPVGEWLFFLFIPYSCLFIFEVVAAYFGAGVALPHLFWIELLCAGVFGIVGIVFRHRGYTCLAMLSSSLYFLSTAVLLPGQIFASGYAISFALIFLVFIIVDGLFTSLPTIIYNEKEILGLRFFSIPLEDFFYNLSYIGLVITVYLLAKALLL